MSAKKHIIKSGKTRSVLLYLFFVLVSTVLWSFVALNKEISQDISVKLSFIDVPSGTTLIDDVPQSVNITISDRGVSLLRYIFGGTPQLQVRFADYANTKTGYFTLNSVQLSALLKKNVLNRGTSIASIDPQEIKVKFTNLPGKKVPLRYDLDIEPNIKYVVNGIPVMSADSVTVFSDRETLAKINEVYTYLVKEKGLTDTLRRNAIVQQIEGAKISPSKVKVEVPIEELVLKKRELTVMQRNMPNGMKILLSPATVTASYLVPKSMYKNTDDDIKAVVDYNLVDWSNHSTKVAVIVGESPAVYRNIQLKPDSLEYIIEKQ